MFLYILINEFTLYIIGWQIFWDDSTSDKLFCMSFDIVIFLV